MRDTASCAHARFICFTSCFSWSALEPHIHTRIPVACRVHLCMRTPDVTRELLPSKNRISAGLKLGSSRLAAVVARMCRSRKSRSWNQMRILAEHRILLTISAISKQRAQPKKNASCSSSSPVRSLKQSPI